jgi:hypothetical protein
MARRPTKNVVLSTLTLLLLCGAAVDRATSMVAPEDTAAYQARVRDAAAHLPERMGDWVGTDIPVPQSAVALLHPNVIVSRRYQNFITGRTADFLLVQCADSRDLTGHYPPICYPNQGYVLERAEPRHWTVDGLPIHATDYRFMQHLDGVESRTQVKNFMILPDGTIAPDMDAVRKSTTVRRRFYGAGQVQVICPAGIPADEQDRIFTSLVEGHMPLISAILSGTPNGNPLK